MRTAFKLKNLFYCFLLLLILFTSNKISAEISTPYEAISQDYDVISYDAEIDLTSYPSTSMTGVCRISVEWRGGTHPNKIFYFHLRDLVVDEIKYMDKVVNYTIVGKPEDTTYHYEFTVPPEYNGVKKVIITITYHGNMTPEYSKYSFKWGGVQSMKNVLFAMGVGFYNNYVSTTQHWLPCYDLPSDKASFKCKFIVPEDKFVASNGLLIEENKPGNGTAEYIWAHSTDCATYNYTFAVSDYVPVNFGDGTIPMVVYCHPKDTNDTKVVFKLLPDMVKTFENKFGTYPFSKVGYVLTPIGSMEHETMISFDSSLVVGRKDTINLTGAHELAHMWFGGLVTPFDFRDAWLNESFATYCESLWLEELFGWDRYLTQQGNKVSSYIAKSTAINGEGIFPIYDFKRNPPSNNYPYETIYVKGAAVVGMLRYELGDSIFYNSLKEYLSYSKYDNVDSDFLKNACEKNSGKDLDWFFNQWVYGQGWLQIRISLSKIDDNNFKIKFTQVQPDSFGIYTNVPIEVGFKQQGGTYEYKIFTLNEKEQSFDVAGGFNFTEVNVNKGQSLRTLLELKGWEIVSVRDILISDGILIYPNPSDSQVIFKFPSKGGHACLTVITKDGRQIFSENFNTFEGDNSHFLNVMDYASGDYYIMINDNNKIYKEKFSVVK